MAATIAGCVGTKIKHLTRAEASPSFKKACHPEPAKLVLAPSKDDNISKEQLTPPAARARGGYHCPHGVRWLPLKCQPMRFGHRFAGHLAIANIHAAGKAVEFAAGFREA